MKKTLTAKVITLFILATFCYQPVTTQFDYNAQTCPLARYNIEVAEDLMNVTQKLLEQVGGQGFDISEVEVNVVEANELLEKARIFCGRGQNCIAGNTLAVRAISLLRKAQEMLESMLDAILVEEYAVYSVLIDKGFHLIEYRYSRDEVQLIVTKDHTRGGKSASEDLNRVLQWVGQEMPTVEQETLDNFLVKNIESHPLHNLFNINFKTVLIGETEATETFQKENGWEDFYAKYPFSQGIMTLSRVGFNSEMNQALVYLENRVHCSIGVGYYVLLTKENGAWAIYDWVTKWMA